MKKVMLIAALALGFVLVFACKSQQPAPAEPPTTEEALKNVYERYYAELILDDAGTYIVKSGDTLAHIARNSDYHNGFYYPIIMLASRDVVLDPDKIEPGMELIIPNLEKNLDNPRAKANIKDFLGEIAKIEDNRTRADTAKGMRDLADTL